MTPNLTFNFAQRCICCDLATDSGSFWCETCLLMLPWQSPACPRCGKLMDLSNSTKEGSACASCAIARPDWDHLLCPWQYRQPISGLIHAFKYQHNFRAGTALAEAFAEYLHSHYPQGDWPDLIIPTPLHWRRRWRRGFNQADFLSYALIKQLQKTGRIHRKQSPEVASDLCRRRRYTPSQQGLSQCEREDNLSGAFHLQPHAIESLRGKHLVFVDDVYTTGSTLRALTQVFLDIDVREFSIWTLCSTARAESSSAGAQNSAATTQKD